ncbi:MAG: hypothetical protein Q8P67_24430, partial [archaeon]|nr:hypothetical protein [archaeon]
HLDEVGGLLSISQSPLVASYQLEDSAWLGDSKGEESEVGVATVGSPSHERPVEAGLQSVTARLGRELPGDRRKERPRKTAITSSGSALLDWNEEFQRLLALPADTPEEKAQRTGALESLMNRFVEACTGIVREIVAEEGVEDQSLRRHRAIAGVGIAGGEKFCVDGIFVKYASVDIFRIYGSDEFAAKSVNHEVRALQVLIDANIPGLSLPLSCGVDWLGRRLFCQALLPLSTDTLAYGSADGGMTVFDSSPAFQSLAMNIATRLNLAPHLVGMRPGHEKRLYLSADIEGHVGLDGRFYLLDSARLFPPEAPSREDPHAIMTRFLRPEFVIAHWVPLNPDAFSRFHSRSDPAFASQRADLLQAHRLLIDRIVELRLELHSRKHDDDILSPEDVALFLHQRGVNLRYLSFLLQCDDLQLPSLPMPNANPSTPSNPSTLSNPAQRPIHNSSKSLTAVDYALVELVARSLKCRAKRSMRSVAPRETKEMGHMIQDLVSQMRTRTVDTFIEACEEKHPREATERVPFQRFESSGLMVQTVIMRFLALIGFDSQRLEFSVRTTRVSVASKVDTIDSLKSEVSLRESTFGKYHEKVGIAKLRLAELLSRSHQPEDAAAMFEQCMCVFEICALNSDLEESDDGELSSTDEDSLQIDTSVPELLESSFEGVTNLCNALYSYGQHLFSVRQLDAAIAQLRRCVILRDRFSSRSQDYLSLGQDLHLLGWLCKSAGYFADAELTLSRAISVQEKCAAHPMGGTSYIELARVYLSMGRRVRVIEALQKQAYRITVGIYGENHSQLAIILNNMAIFALWQGRIGDAERWASRAFDIRVFSLGPQHHYSSHSLLLLSQVQMYSGSLLAAAENSTSAQHVYENSKAHWLVLNAIAVRARLMQYFGRLDEAMALVEQILQHPTISLPSSATMRAATLIERAVIRLSIGVDASSLTSATSDTQQAAQLLTASANPHHFVQAVRLTQMISDMYPSTTFDITPFFVATRKIIVSELILWMKPASSSTPSSASSSSVPTP